MHRGRPVRCLSSEDDALSLSTSAASAANTGARAVKAAASYDSDQLLDAILKSLDDDKAEEVVKINLRGKSEMGDWMVIASGRSTRQVSAMAEKLTEKLKSEYGIISKIEGKDIGDWVLIDTGDVIVHLFRPEVREFYQLEKMWTPGAQDDLAMDPNKAP
ncbi:ribosome silencing factor [Loktanella sp. R86503]|uniref:ribosome silencing factor n=1 Tax=Loktanella sp. R86503 TaxID=3093847 RepID=UPI0036DE8741